MIATLMFVCSTLMRAIRMVTSSYTEASDLRVAARKAYPFSEG